VNANPQLARAIRGPVLLITIGTLFALDHLGDFDFSRTWPILIIVIGLMKLFERSTSTGTMPPPGPFGNPNYAPPSYGAPNYPPPANPGVPYTRPPYTPPAPSPQAPAPAPPQTPNSPEGEIR
jgi:hypothetical protein